MGPVCVPPESARVTDRCPLSEREHAVMVLLMLGRSYKQAAEHLGVSPSTVRSQAHAAYRKMGVSGLGPAIAMMHRERWVFEPLLPSFQGPEYSETRRSRFVESWRPSPAQRAYLDAFDRLLRERSPEAARIVAAAFTVLCGEADATFPRRRGAPDVDGMLEQIAYGLARKIPC